LFIKFCRKQFHPKSRHYSMEKCLPNANNLSNLSALQSMSKEYLVLSQLEQTTK
jgi:hypothetical protein